jgi:hypothetical protein
LSRQPITTLFEASDQDLVEGMEIWTPVGVVEELVRQFPERVARMKEVLGAIRHGIRKGEAIHLPEDSAITVYDWDWNESMVAAEAELPVEALVEVRLGAEGDLAVSIVETRVG